MKVAKDLVVSVAYQVRTEDADPRRAPPFRADFLCYNPPALVLPGDSRHAGTVADNPIVPSAPHRRPNPSGGV